MRPTRSLAALAAVVTSTAVLTAVAPAAHADPVEVSGVQFRWGFNHESNNSGAAPGTVNLFSAGKLGNPGSSQLLSSSSQGATWSGGQDAGWTAHEGNVYIEKLQADGAHALATWAGTRTTKDGTPLGNYAVNTAFSDHEVVIDAGLGSLDPVADDATIDWTGDFTVVYYSGYTFFYVSDPRLVLDGGSGTVTATLGGYGTDMNDMDTWVELPDTEVTLATLSGVDVTADGLVATPAYHQVEYDLPEGGTNQVRTGEHWGAFPETFVDFQQLTGQSLYWYSSGGSVDRNKTPLPITVDTTPAPHETAPVTPTVGVAAPAVAYGRAARVTVTLAPAPAAGSVTLSGAGGTRTASISGGRATFALPATLKPGRHALTASYAGDGELTAANGAGALTVTKAGVAKPVLRVTSKPTVKKRGQVQVTVASTTPAAAAGKLTVTLTKAGATKKATGTVKNGKVSVKLPKLAKGAWKATASYAGSATHAAGSSKPLTIRVK